MLEHPEVQSLDMLWVGIYVTLWHKYRLVLGFDEVMITFTISENLI
jgi:hypothetical protein